jgi:hypothetical protein
LSLTFGGVRAMYPNDDRVNLPPATPLSGERVARRVVENGPVRQ